jgi:alpha-beta hydrolase superfamily lysophospholipase
MAADTVVLIHGLYLTPLSWEHWVSHYEKRGFTVVTPSYPGIAPGESGVAAIRTDPSPLAGLGVREIEDHLSAVIEALPSKPIIMGHSFGGLFVQLLLDNGLGCAGVSINGAGAKGVLALPPSQIKSTIGVFKDPANARRAVPITEKEMHYAFTNTLGVTDAKAVYDRYSIPVSGRMLFQAGLANFTPHAATTVSYANSSRAPLLFIAGGKDHVVPAAVQRENYKKHAKHSSAITAFKLYEGRSHFTCGEPGWQTVADDVLDWALTPRAGLLS